MTRAHQFAHRIDPKLRMILDGDGEVNTRRAESSGSVQALPTLIETYTAQVRGLDAEPGKPASAPDPPSKDGKFPEDIMVSVFVELSDDVLPEDLSKLKPTAQRGKLITTEVIQSQIEEISGYEGVAYLSPGDTLSSPTPDRSPAHTGAAISRSIKSKWAKSGGKGVILGLIDVEGFDFAHPDFLDDNENTRFISIWDQGGEDSSSREVPYGTVLTQQKMNAALLGGKVHKVGATDLLPQSVQLCGAHGTHVASIAAGNSGVAPKAEIAGVLIELTSEDEDRRQSFYDSTRLAHAVDYLFTLGQNCKPPKPVVINISLGTNGHAHDGSSPISRWIDAALSVPGQCVCVAAGNAGQEAPQFDSDIGHMMGRIHTSGQIPATGLETDIEWQVVGNGISDGSENELNIWYEPQDRFEVLLISPDGEEFGPVSSGEFFENKQLKSGTFISIYNERYHPHNGTNRITVFLSPRLKEPYIGVKAGIWTVRLRGESIRDGHYHAWIERDDPRPLGRVGNKEIWRFPSCFTKSSNVDNSSINSLACGNRIISVANYDEQGDQVNKSSSQGPSRDGRLKPEIAAPGTNILAASGFSPSHRKWISMSGTSMASPYAAGVAALMLAVKTQLTASQIIGIMRRTAQPLPGSDYLWQDDAGFGRIQPALCLKEANKAYKQIERLKGR